MATLKKADPFIGKKLGHVMVKEFLGAGAMGVVYKGVHEYLGTSVAVKFMTQAISHNEEFVQRFMREARIMASVDHPNVVRVMDAGESEGLHYMVMELIEGMSLSDYVTKKVRISYNEAISIIRECVHGLDAANEKKIIHRDIKPANIMITTTGNVKVADFGLAKLVEGSMGATGSGQMMGTPLYISPEQCNGLKEVDFRTDMYSLGVTLYRITTGQVPFSGPTPIAILYKHVHEAFKLPGDVVEDYPETLSRVVCKMLAKDPAERYSSYAELDKALAEAQGDETVQAGTFAMPINLLEAETSGTFKRSAGPMLIGISDASNLYEDDEAEKAAQAGPGRGKIIAVSAGIAAAVLLVGIGLYAYFAKTAPAANTTVTTALTADAAWAACEARIRELEARMDTLKPEEGLNEVDRLLSDLKMLASQFQDDEKGAAFRQRLQDVEKAFLARGVRRACDMADKDPVAAMGMINPLTDLLAKAQKEYGQESWLMDLIQQLADAKKRAAVNGLTAATGMVAALEKDFQENKLDKLDESIGRAKNSLDRSAAVFPGEPGYDPLQVRLQNIENKIRGFQSAGKQYEKAIACLQKGDLNGAKALLDMIVNRYPDSPQFDAAFALTRVIDTLPPRLAAVDAALRSLDIGKARELCSSLKTDIPQLGTLDDYERKISTLEMKLAELKNLVAEASQLQAQGEYEDALAHVATARKIAKEIGYSTVELDRLEKSIMFGEAMLAVQTAIQAEKYTEALDRLAPAAKLVQTEDDKNAVRAVLLTLTGKLIPLSIVDSRDKTMMLIPYGVYFIGDKDGRSENALPRRQITIEKPFYMDVSEVANGEFMRVFPDHKKKYADKGYVERFGQEMMSRLGERDLPVTMVTTKEAEKYVTKLTAQSPDRGGYRLPDEVEWEVAAKGGRDLTFSHDALYVGGKKSPSNAVSTFTNPFGLSHMCGNVAEICLEAGKKDAYVVRGGTYSVPNELVAALATTSARVQMDPSKRSPSIGFRCVREVDDGLWKKIRAVEDLLAQGR